MSQDICQLIEQAVSQAIPGAQVRTRGEGGHFEIQVISQAFEGQGLLQRHRMVLQAIAHLMQGADAPVHAIDRIDARTP